MRTLFLFALIVLNTASFCAQEKGKFRGGLDLGYVSANGENGSLVSVEFKYNLTDNSNIGLRLGGSGFGREVEGAISDVAITGNIIGTYDYYFHKNTSSVAPFLGIGLGVYDRAKVDFEIVGIPYTSEEDTNVGGMVRGGVELGKFRLFVEYDLVPKTDLDSGESIKNSYFGAGAGFYLGGGKWKK